MSSSDLVLYMFYTCIFENRFGSTVANRLEPAFMMTNGRIQRNNRTSSRRHNQDSIIEFII